MRKRLAIFFSAILLGFQAKAVEIYEYQRPIRAWGMGGVAIPFVNDTDAPMLNPAALAYVDSISWRLFNADMGAGVAGFSSLSSLSSLSSVSGASGLSQFYGKKISINGFGASSFTMPHFGASVYGELNLSAVLHTPAFPEFDMTFLSDYGGVVATGFGIGPFMSMGIAAKRINRWGGTQAIGLSTITSLTSVTGLQGSFLNKGVGYGADLALMARAPILFQPTAAVVWKDIGDTSFSMEQGTAPPDAIKNNLTFAFGTKLDLPGLDVSTGIEYQHFNDSGLQFGQKLHLGTEISLPIFDLRAGLNQGYPSYGIGMDFFLIRLDAAYFAVETGAYPGQTRQDRFEVGLSMEFSIDANFNFYDKNGKRRKLKQRR